MSIRANRKIQFIEALTNKEDKQWEDLEEDVDEHDEAVMRMKKLHQLINEDHIAFPTYEKFWGFTNFNIGKQTVSKISEVPGIEKVRIASRYTMYIIVGKMFESVEVLNNIKKAVSDDGV